MIGAVVRPRDVALWTEAVRRAGLSGSVQVVTDVRELPSGELKAMLTDLRGDPRCVDVCRLAVRLVGVPTVLMGRTAESDALKDLADEGRSLVDGRYVMSLNFAAEQYGTPSICHVSMLVLPPVGWGFVDIPIMHPLAGPGVFDAQGRGVLWDTERLAGLGTPVSRDDPMVISSVYAALTGNGPLWASPGFPFRIPGHPSTYQSLQGRTVQGMLVTSTERSGGFSVLERHELLGVLGHPNPDIPWSELHQIIAVEPAAALLGWMAAMTVAPTRT